LEKALVLSCLGFSAQYSADGNLDRKKEKTYNEGKEGMEK